MNEAEFSEFLRRGGRSASAITRCIRYLREFEAYLQEAGGRKDAASATPHDLEGFVAWIEREPKVSAKTHLWALCYYYEYVPDEEMRHLARVLREQRITRRPFPLSGFRDVNSESLKRLAAAGIRNSEQMLSAGRTPADRQTLATTTEVPEEVILELAKLSDLARIRGVKGIRARLYYDAGVETVEQMAGWDADDLRSMIVDFVDRTGFDGLPTLQAEARFTVVEARKLPKRLEL